jgi:hypothetical protein
MTIMLYCLAFHFPLAFAQEFRYDSHGRRDPFIPSASEFEGVSGELHLEGIVFDPKGDSMAIVNGQTLRVGDTINGTVLKKLGENRAWFEREGESFEVILSQDEEIIQQYLAGKPVNNLLEVADKKMAMCQGSVQTSKQTRSETRPQTRTESRSQSVPSGGPPGF